MDSQIKKIKRGISRLIDSYQDGVLLKNEFEPRVLRAKDRLEKLEEEKSNQKLENEQKISLELIIGKFKDFAFKVKEGLDNASWKMKREIIRAMVKEIKIQKEEVDIVYKISPNISINSDLKKSLQHCLRRDFTSPC